MDIDKRILAAGVLGALLLAILAYFVVSEFFSKKGYEGELFSLTPSEGLTGVAYAELSGEGAEKVLSLYGLSGVGQDLQGAYLAVSDYKGGEQAWSAFIMTSTSPQGLVDRYGDRLGGLESENLFVGGKEVVAAYQKSDLEKKNPICIWKREGGLGILALTGQPFNSFCRFPSDFSCRGQLFESSLLRVKVKSTGERIVVTEAACGGASLSSKNLRYVLIQDILVGPDKEIWLDEIPCYDAGNTLARGSSFSGKIFLKYYLESEGPSSPRIVSGDVGASSGAMVLSGARCTDLLENSYGPSRALSLLSFDRNQEPALLRQGDLSGKLRLSNGLGKAWAAALEKQEATYIFLTGDAALVANLSGIGGAGDLRCINGPYGLADLFSKSGKLVCRRAFEGFLSGLAYERISGQGNAVTVMTMPNYESERTERTALDLAFGVELAGEDAGWVNETSGSVMVYLVNGTRGANESQVPLEGAQVELYSTVVASEGMLGNLLEAKTTGPDGKAIFNHVPLGGGIVLANKRGYLTREGSRLAQASLTLNVSFSAVFHLISESSENETIFDYMAESNLTSVSTGLIDARGSFPSLSAYGITLVNSSGGVESLVLVGKRAPAEEVLAASRIADSLASREFDCNVLIPKDGLRVEPLKSIPQLLVLDSPRPEGPLIAVGDPETNAALREAVGLAPDFPPFFVSEMGNIVAVVGRGRDAMKAAKDFVNSINYSLGGCGASTHYGEMKLIDLTGRPAVRVVIGSRATTEEALAGAYLAQKLASLSAMCVRANEETVGCAPSKGNPEQIVVSEDNVPTGYPLISIGGPTANSFNDRTCSECSALAEGKALVRPISKNIHISGYRMEDTLVAASQFITAIESPLPSAQEEPYYAIKLSGFIQKENGHHELTLSFYGQEGEIQGGRAMPGEFYVMHGGKIAKVVSVSARNVGSASVTFDIAGQKTEVGMGRFLCRKGNAEDLFKYCINDRVNTTISIEASPNPAVFMGSLKVYVDYTNETEDVLGANCSYCIAGRNTLCRPLEYKGIRGEYYADEFIVQLPMGTYLLEANCSAEDHANATGRLNLTITRVELPDLVVDGLWIKSISSPKLTFGMRIKNIGSIPYSTSKSPLVTCFWDRAGRNLLSHISYNVTIKPTESFEFTQSLNLPLVENNNSLVAKVDCNNLQAEENENNNDKEVSFGRYG